MSINPNPPITIEAFEAFLKKRVNGHEFWELIDGELVERGNTFEQGLIVGNLIYLLHAYSRKHNQGRVGTSIWHHKLSDLYDVRMPKIAFYMDDERPVVTTGFVPVYPDLAVEVDSSYENSTDIAQRSRFYLSRGTKTVWLVYPDQKIIDVITSHNTQTLRQADVLTGGDVLPGFSVPVAEIFQLDPSES